MLRLVEAELRKLRGSLVVLLITVPPLLPGLLIALALASRDGAPQWSQILDELTLPLWAMFLNPTLLATLATLMGDVEYRNNGWDFTLTQPYARWRIFLAKLTVIVPLHAAMTAIAVCFAILAGLTVGAVKGNLPTGDLQLQDYALFVLRMTAGSFCILALQLWVALRWKNFLLPLSLGIAGTLVALAVLMTGTSDADWFPWVVALKSAMGEGAGDSAWTGLAMGGVVCTAMLADLQRRTFR
ncbi:MAG: ABC transporter permease subunit [Erythrobacter sp.]|nr:ABC transporter permease subunit [Erythrobacter sp.]NCQ63333.1 ABC transporter permease subunit [Alphaproteobacteria bacterium]